MNASEIATQILSAKMTTSDLSLIQQALNTAKAKMVQEKKVQFRIGDKVKWSSTKSPGQGSIEKIAIKYAVVDTVTGKWKVPISVLEKI